MKQIDKQVQLVKGKLLNMLLPEGMSPKEKEALANRAGVRPETLRNLQRRHTLHGETLLRLLLAKGVPVEVLSNLPQTEESALSRDEIDWAELGRELTASERREFCSLIKYLRSRWNLSA